LVLAVESSLHVCPGEDACADMQPNPKSAARNPKQIRMIKMIGILDCGGHHDAHS
jgi:hypothetical protein